MTILILLAAGLVFASLLMAVVWGVAVRIRNAGIVDVAWSWSFAPVAVIYVALAPDPGPSAWLMTGMMTIWSLRLGTYLYRRVMGHHPVEDSRYQDLRQRWSGRANKRFFWFFQAQALAAVFFTLPAATVAAAGDVAPGGIEWTGFGVWAVGVLGESLADWQLARFKAEARNSGRICRAGLWNYSRHPNYFFEWVAWCGFAVFAFGSPHGWLSLSCAVAMLYLLLRVTGIPALERAALERRGDAYREYQRTTSAFVPWFTRT